MLKQSAKTLLLVVIALFVRDIQAQTISTIAGIGNGDGYNAVSVSIRGGTKTFPVASDKKGNVYFTNGSSIRKISPAGILSTIAGIEFKNGFSGDGGPAAAALLGYITDMTTDTAGNLYINDVDSSCIRKINTNGIISTIAGTRSRGFSGDGGLAVNAQLNYPVSIAVDATGNIYIYDNLRIRKVSVNGIISTIAGGGTTNFLTIGKLATNSNLQYNGSSLAVDSKNNFYINGFDSTFRSGIYKIASNGTVVKFISGDLSVNRLNIDLEDNLYITNNDYFQNGGYIKKLDTLGNITTIASYPSISLSPYNSNVAFDNSGSVYVPTVDSTLNVYGIVKISKGGSVVTVAGNGSSVYNGDNIPALNAQFFPVSIATDTTGNIYMADVFSRVRKISTNNIITTIAGTNSLGFAGDKGPATNARLDFPAGITIDNKNNLLICDQGNNKIRKVTNGIITTIAGKDSVDQYGYDYYIANRYNGDNIPADSAFLSHPISVATDTAGNIFIADQDNHRIRKINGKGIITTIAGTGTAGYSGDGSLAINAKIGQPYCVTTDLKGNVYFGDANHTVRKIATNGIITTIAGNGTEGYSGDGGKAVNAKLNFPYGIVIAKDGTIFIAELYNHIIRKIGTDSIISTIAGTGTESFSGDGGLAKGAGLNYPAGVAIDKAGNLLIADAYNYRIRKITPAPLPLDLVSFTANLQNQIVQTNWQTANEVNTSYFNVQHSTNNSIFNTIGTVKATGTGANLYSFIHTTPLPGTNYYRLQNTDKDGKYTFSNVVAVNINAPIYNLHIFPNPVKDNLFIQLKNNRAESIIVQVADLAGKVISQQQIRVQAGSNNFSISTSLLKRGNYILIVKGEKIFQEKFIKL